MSENTTTHTPGPWSTVNHYDMVAVSMDKIIADIRHRTDLYDVEAAANARLIAAAPELLAALKAMLELWGVAGFAECADGSCTCVQRQALAAIAKAEGR